MTEDLEHAAVEAILERNVNDWMKVLCDSLEWM